MRTGTNVGSVVACAGRYSSATKSRQRSKRRRNMMCCISSANARAWPHLAPSSSRHDLLVCAAVPHTRQFAAPQTPGRLATALALGGDSITPRPCPKYAAILCEITSPVCPYFPSASPPNPFAPASLCPGHTPQTRHCFETSTR
ncbi:unnamed protein product, partial [Ectocarpus sp. 12 AP-2014]